MLIDRPDITRDIAKSRVKRSALLIWWLIIRVTPQTWSRSSERFAFPFPFYFISDQRISGNRLNNCIIRNKAEGYSNKQLRFAACVIGTRRGIIRFVAKHELPVWKLQKITNYDRSRGFCVARSWQFCGPRLISHLPAFAQYMLITFAPRWMDVARGTATSPALLCEWKIGRNVMTDIM